ncbi:hypothetical protein [Maribacter sp. 2304DJ31-5]|uniref:hypothetical protein n=1 Tax=Maribacter sp. 2304DJ31-5 TaxID=3386273 RepID=UPI0039BCEA68
MQEKGFKILLNVDKHMSRQQNLQKYNVSLLVFRAKDTRYDSLVPFVSIIEKLLKKIFPRDLPFKIKSVFTTGKKQFLRPAKIF